MSLFSKTNRSEGFTLVEMLVSLGIMVSIISVVAVGQTTYTQRAALLAQAENLSLSLTQARVYGTSVREALTGTQDFNAAFGVEISLLGNGAGKEYIFFVDRQTKNNIYDGDHSCAGSDPECFEKIVLTQNVSLSSICLIPVTGEENCAIGRVDLSFQRPYVEAILKFFDSHGVAVSPPNAIGARINLRSLNGQTVSVLVYTTGQISVQ